jgi:hypothetical protein
MKRIVYILVFALSLSSVSFAQADEDAGGKLRDKMIEYIQNKLNLSKGEAEKFQPVFLDYLKDMRSTKQQFGGDRLILQQKIVDLRIRYRDQFKPIIGEPRSNAVFQHEHDFVQKAIQERNDRLQNRLDSRANKKTGLLQ